MRRVIHRTKGELLMRKALISRLLSLGVDVLTGVGDTERRIQTYISHQNRNYSLFGQLRFVCTAAWLHPAGSAMMYLHYREVSGKRLVPENLERWGVKLMLGTPTIAEALYGGSWKVAFERKEEKS